MMATIHLEPLEELAYRRLMDLYFTCEKPIPLETQWVSRRLRLGSEVIERVLEDLFEKTPEGWRNDAFDRQLAEYHAMSDRNKRNGSLGGRPKKTQSVSSGLPVGTQSEPTGKPTINYKPITNNQEESRGDAAHVSGFALDPEPPENSAATPKTSRSQPDREPSGASPKPRPAPPPALPFDSPEFSAAWAKWVQHRKEIRKPLTPTQMGEQLEGMRRMGERRAIVMMNHTIKSGWQGLREPEPSRTPSGPRSCLNDTIARGGCL